MTWRAWLGLPEQGESRTLTPDVVYGDAVPFNYAPGAASAPVSQSRALALAPVYAANRLIADSVSTLPIKGYRRLADKRMPMSGLPVLFDTLANEGTLVPWLYRCTTSLGLRGNAYGLVVARDGYQYPTQVEWLSPSLVAPDDRPNARGGWLYNGAPVAREDMVHITRFTLPGERIGLSPIGAFAATIGVGLNVQQYGSDWFAGGGFPPGTFKNAEKTVTQEEAEIIKARLVSSIRTRTPVVYGRDWDYNPITVPPNEAQFIETTKLNATQIAAIYGVPAEEIGGESGKSNTYQNVEQKMLNYTTFNLRAWLVILETAFSALLPERQYVKFNSDALVRADLRTRWDVSKIRVEMGAASIDEIRTQEDQEPLPNGQGAKYAVPSAAPAAAPAPAADDGDQPAGGATRIRRIQ